MAHIDPIDIVNEFTTHPLGTSPYPNDEYWIKKLCALAERLVDAEMRADWRGRTKMGGKTGKRDRQVFDGEVGRSVNEQHRKRGSAEYRAWQAMKKRCYDPKFRFYYRYGGRGITVCDRWRESFSAFFEDMGPRPTAHSTLDRINVDGNYEPGNCRWASQRTQMNNTTRTKYVEYKGKRWAFAELCHSLGLSYDVIKLRMRRGWTLEQAIETPLKQRVHMITNDGVTKRLAHWCRDLNLDESEVSYRLNRGGWTIKEALTTPTKRGYRYEKQRA